MGCLARSASIQVGYVRLGSNIFGFRLLPAFPSCDFWAGLDASLAISFWAGYFLEPGGSVCEPPPWALAFSEKTPSEKAPSKNASFQKAFSEKVPSDKASFDHVSSEKGLAVKSFFENALSGKILSEKASFGNVCSGKACL